MTTATKRKRTKGIREYTDPARPPKCNEYGEAWWDGERWQRKLNRRGQLKLAFWFADHGDGGRRIIGLLRKMHPKAYRVLHARLNGDWDDAVAALWTEGVYSLLRWDRTRCRFQTVLGWAMKAAGGRLLEAMFHPKNQFHLSFTFASEMDDPARTGDSLMERAATDRYEREQAAGEDDRGDVWELVRKALANDPKAVKVLRLRYGQGLTLREVGELVGLTKERVRQIEVQALKNVRERSSLSQLSGDGECRSSGS